ncbi:MAG: NAD+ synthase [Candidatus Acetothermia bacterium]
MRVPTDLRLGNPGKEAKRIEAFIRGNVREAGFESAVVGLSGGIDSTLSTILSYRAIGRDDVEIVFMPEETTPESDSEDVWRLADKFDLDVTEIGIGPIVDRFQESLSAGGSLTLANVKARVRMTLLYARANEIDGLVVGTGNLSEWLLGYFTKHGDGAADIAPIKHLYKTELRDLAEYLDVPETIIDKPPSAGLWSGQTDEEELGGSYEDIDKVLYCLQDLGLGRFEVKEKLDLDEPLIERVYSMVNGSDHKRNLPPGLDRFREG